MSDLAYLEISLNDLRDQVSSHIASITTLINSGLERQDNIDNTVAQFSLTSAQQVSLLHNEIDESNVVLTTLADSLIKRVADLGDECVVLLEQISRISQIVGELTSATENRVDNLEVALSELVHITASLHDRLSSEHKDIKDSINSLGSSQQSRWGQYSTELASIFSGDIELALVSGSLAENVSAAALNAAAADTFQLTLDVNLGTAAGDCHKHFKFEPVITPAEAVVDSDVGIPVVEWTDNPGSTPVFTDGIMRLTVTFDTDAGATKTYVDGESLTVTINVSNNILCANTSNLVKTYNIIA